MNNDEIRIITRADDMGVAGNANRAIVEALTRGVARNVSVLTGSPCFEEADERVLEVIRKRGIRPIRYSEA